MTPNDHPLAAQQPAAADGSDAQDLAGGYARLSRRMSRFAVNLVATVAILLMALVVGRNLVDYWRRAAATVPAPGTASAPSAHNAADAQSIQLDFGDSQATVFRSSTVGDRQAALTELRRLCRTVLKDSGTNSPGQIQDSSEQALLNLVAHQAPAERVGADGELYEAPSALTMVIGTRNTEEIPPKGAAEFGAARRRVVVWGLAIPAGEGRWGAYAFKPQAVAAKAPSPGAEIPTDLVPLPPGAARVLSIRGADSATITVFRGKTTVEEWTRYFDTKLAESNWKNTSPWGETNEFWQAQFVRRGPDARQLDVQISQDGNGGELRGILTTMSLGSRGDE